jgi:hypothetical protein
MDTFLLLGKLASLWGAIYVFSKSLICALKACICRPLIGGLLAHPTVRYPDIFGRFEFLRTYPYFLPCGVIGTLAIVWWFVTFLFLDEVRQPPSS